ncbi:hypothetical protein [Curtobacterium sp. MCLR17_055]|uniref:hypothetical protein n=1 Tax=Curtobacterium sp. MCLR17_055 TaxID=2175633 RepID=UPI0011B63C2D|nr:hypothetical protein [Curtobacterium sp. MCLR17_055]
MPELTDLLDATHRGNLILQPAGPAARTNLNETVHKPVDRVRWAPHLGADDRRSLERSHPSGQVPMWGTTAGQRGQMRSRWERIRYGDAIFFLGGNHAFLAATITHKWVSESLADELWPRKRSADGNARPWELMFSFTDPVEVRLSYADMAEASARVRALGTREFNVYGTEVSVPVLALLDQDTSALIRPVGGFDYPSIARRFDELDAEVTTTRRLEQRYLRTWILPGDSGVCAMCGRFMESSFLVAAHIKRRSDCSDDEKNDLPAIAMAACKFGCDELYERGLIWVDDRGRLKKSKDLSDAEALSYWRAKLRGQVVDIWHSRPESRRYFAAHRERFGHN